MIYFRQYFDAYGYLQHTLVLIKLIEVQTASTDYRFESISSRQCTAAVNESSNAQLLKT